MRPERTKNFLRGWRHVYTPREKRRLKRAASKASRAAERVALL